MPKSPWPNKALRDASEGDEREQLDWLLARQSVLDSRIEQIENSVIFKALRSAGSVYQAMFGGTRKTSVPAYRRWRAQHGAPTLLPAGRLTDNNLLVSVVQRNSAIPPLSLEQQTYRNWEFCGSAGNQPSGDYIAVLNESETLAPFALQLAVDAIGSERPDLVYFDHEEADHLGRPLRPVFKPDWSPSLTDSCAYMGSFFLQSRDVEDRLSQVIHVPEIAYATRSHQEFELPRNATGKSENYGGNLKVSILVCSRTPVLLDRCLGQLRQRTRYQNFEVIVIHHAGFETDREMENVIRRHGAKRIAYTEAFNFAAMNNLGSREASGEVFLFLNDDVEPIEPDWLSLLLRRLLQPKVGVVGPLLLYRNGSIQHAGITVWPTMGAGHPGRGLHSSENWRWLRFTREVTAVTGACLCIRRSDFESVQGFDPIFPVNFNDVDLCLRIGERGLSTVIDTAAILRHDESLTRRPGVKSEEEMRFFFRWQRTLRVDPFYNKHLVQRSESLSLG